MKVSTPAIEKIANTLPIGYYAKRNIGLTIKDGEKTSYYSPMEDAIVVSADIIKTAVEPYPDSYDIETAVRSMLYHEVSHAILTPPTEVTPVFNIFEDERIETLLANFYMDVDFRQQVYDINQGYNGQYPQSAIDAFYQVVRFHRDTEFPYLVKKVQNMIEKYSHLSRENDSLDVWLYKKDIENFYKLVAKEYGFPTKNEDISRSDSSVAKPNSSNDGEKTESENENSAKNEQAQDGEENGKEMFPNNGSGCSTNAMNRAMNNFYQSTNKFIDKNLTDSIRQIFNTFNKRTNNNGSCLNGYSGIFDPRSVIRDDYKFFIRSNSRGNGKAFSKFNLNLFIDSSGSFCCSEEAVNTIIHSLMDIEKENPMFTFTLTTINTCITELFGTKRVLQTGGGSRLLSTMSKVYRSKQRADAVNYNIALFDGEMSGGNNFSAFNNGNCTIIAEDSNKKNIEKYAGSAKHIYENHSYAQRLKDNILSILTIAFS